MSRDKVWSKDFSIHTLSYFFMGMAFYFLIPTLPIYITDVLKKSEGQVGLIMGAYALASLIIRPFAGVAFDYYGRKNLYLFSLTMFALVVFSYEFTYTMFILFVIRLFHGLSWGILTTGGSTVATDLLPESRRGEGIGYFGLSFTLSMAIGPLVGVWLLNKTDFSSLFLYAGLAGTVALLLAFLIHYPRNNQRGVKITASSFFEKRAIHISFIMLIMAVQYAAILSFITIYAKQIGVDRVDDFYILFDVGIAITRPIAGRIMDKTGPEKIMLASFIISASGLVLLSYSTNYMNFLTSAFVIGFGLGVLMPVLLTMLMNLVEPERRGAANSTFYSAIDLGFGMGAFILGYIAEWFSLAIMFRTCGLLILLPTLYFFLITIKHYRKNLILNP